MGKFNFDDLIDDDNSVGFEDEDIAPKEEEPINEPEPEKEEEPVIYEPEEPEEEPVVAEKLEQIEKVVEEIIEIQETPSEKETEADKIIDEIEEMVAETYIENIEQVVEIAEADLETEEEEREREKIEKPLREKEELRQKLLAKKKEPKPDDEDDDGGDDGSGDDEDGVIEKSVATIMHESMIPYSEFVILDRALPRVEDGLKPVQRRILYAMNDMGLMPDKPFRKSAGIVGECLGKYHPHGDTSVYDAMVRLAQPFNMNMPLVLGQGNFGSDDGDGAAAMRYTEAKLAPLALELLRDIDKKTVPFSLTYDDRNTEPDVLPARFPNLLTNGSSGIAVGLATNIPPHNLGEVIDAHIAYIENPHITLKQVLKIIKGPDFPTGGWITTGDDMIRAYETGRGKVVMSGDVHIEVDGDKRNIVITELPYQVNKVQLQRSIADLRESKKGILQNITEIRDESDRNGTRIIIKLRKDTDARAVVALLYKHTQLQCNFNFNIVAIAGGKPRQMGLLSMIEYYVEYQREVIYKRSVFELATAKERAHIVEGLLVAIKNIDEVIKIIKSSKHTTEARLRLMQRFKLSERQAQAILDLRLARLTSLEVYKLEEELQDLYRQIELLTAIINSKKRQFDVVKKEMNDIKRRFYVERRTRVVSKAEDIVVTADDDAKPVEDCVIIITVAGDVKRVALKHFNMCKTGAWDGMHDADIHFVSVKTQTDKHLHFFTNMGRCYKLFGDDIPECKLKDSGIKFKTLFPQAADNERPVSVYATIPDQFPELEIVWLSKTGMIKRSKFADACGVLKSIFDCYKLREDRLDEIVKVETLKKDRTIVMVTNKGMVLNATTGDIPIQGRIATGVKGIQIDETMFCAGIGTAKNQGFIIAVSNMGSVKKVEVKDIDKMVRYRKGLQFVNDFGRNEELIFAGWTRGGEDLVVKTANGKIFWKDIDAIAVSPRTGKTKNTFASVKPIAFACIHRRNTFKSEY